MTLNGAIMVSRPRTSDQVPVARQKTRATLVSPPCLMNALWLSCDKKERRERRWDDEMGGGVAVGVGFLALWAHMTFTWVVWIKPSRSSRSLWRKHLHHATWAELLPPDRPHPPIFDKEHPFSFVFLDWWLFLELRLRWLFRLTLFFDTIISTKVMVSFHLLHTSCNSHLHQIGFCLWKSCQN